jgi:Skp family chaperone for outer membrane proteins
MNGISMVAVSILSALAVQAFDGWINPPRRFAHVDVMLVIQEQIDSMAVSKMDKHLTASAESIGHRVERVIEEMAHDYGVTLLVTQAVVTEDMPDLTDELRQRVEKRWRN